MKEQLGDSLCKDAEARCSGGQQDEWALGGARSAGVEGLLTRHT